MNSRPRAVSDIVYILSCFLFDSPAGTVEAAKHPGTLDQIILLFKPLITDRKRQPAKVAPRTRHTGDVEGDVAALGCQS